MIEIPNVNRVGLLMSGGIDSTMMAFLANKYFPNKEYFACIGIKNEKPDQLYRVQKILQYIGLIIPIITWNNTTQPGQRRGDIDRENRERVAKKYNIHCMINGRNHLPKDPEFGVDEFTNNKRLKEVRTGKKPTLQWKGHYWHYRPFEYEDKKYIIDLYYKYDLLELLNMTQSCHQSPPCEECFNCKEKYWAYGSF